MPNLQIPGALCASLHPQYTGPDSPKQVLGTIIEAARKMVVGVVEAGVPAAKLPTSHDPGVNRNVSFPAAIMSVIDEHAYTANLTQSEAIRAYLYAAIARGDALAHRITEKDNMAAYTGALGLGFRQEQSLLFDCLIDTLGKHQVGLIEGATGIGKTLAMIAAASETISDGGRAVICTPTIQVLREFISTHDRLASEMPDLPGMRVVLGKPEYVSRELIEEALDEGAVAVDPVPIRKWLSDGAPPIGSDESLGCFYLASSLLAISPNFPAEGARLTDRTSSEDPGMQAYRSQFEREQGDEAREIVYCTHAMVAIDLRMVLQNSARSEAMAEARANSSETVRKLLAERDTFLDGDPDTRKINKRIFDALNEVDLMVGRVARDMDYGRLPPWQFLIIDEAHLFEPNVANVLSSSLSMMEYRGKVRKAVAAGYLPERALTSVNRALATLRGLSANGDIDLNNPNGGEEAPRNAAIKARIALADAAAAICSARRKADEPPAVADIRSDAQEIKRALDIVNTSAKINSCTLGYSPVREFPQLTYGRRSIERELRILWERALGVACVSATLYLRKLDRYSASYMSNLLRLPESRIREFPPIRPSWSLSPVTGLWVPEKRQIGDRYWLQPPSRRDMKTSDENISDEHSKRLHAQWTEEVADAIADINKTAVGGTLVLMTSYQSLHQVAHLLAGRIASLVQASTKTSLSQQLALFIDYAQAGRKPVWLALGGAWTGLDVNGANYDIKKPTEDNLITDLVIPRIPFGLNKSLTQLHRMSIQSAVPWDLLDAVMRFKQGIGRLVRREGLPNNRRIFVLDGRLNDPRFSNYLLPIRQVMDIYPTMAYPVRDIKRSSKTD